MPRTKKVDKKVKVVQNAHKQYREDLKFVLECVRKKKDEIIQKLEEARKKMLVEYREFGEVQNSTIPYKYLNMTLREYEEHKSSSASETVSCASKESLLNITKSVRKNDSKRKVNRSASFADDEGYLTAESVTSGGRKSRNKLKVPPTNRRTRSLSRSTAKKATGVYNTPMNKVIPPESYGVVTPKCKPNTPQVLLRRPKNGEIALSIQGSPLYTASVVTENMANINIPLLDGRLLTLQPQKGLRVSQIPEFDPETLRQLETLKENLSRVVAASNNRS